MSRQQKILLGIGIFIFVGGVIFISAGPSFNTKLFDLYNKAVTVSENIGNALLSPSDYSEKIINLDDQILKDFKQIDDGFETEDGERMERLRLGIIATIEKNTQTLNNIASKVEDFGFKKGMQDIFALYKKWATVEYKELQEIYAKDDLSDADFSRIDALYDQMEEEEKGPLDIVVKAQQKFAKTYKFQLER